MNTFLQIGLGLLPGLIVVWILQVKRKAYTLKRILLTVLFTAACAGLLISGLLANSGGRGAYKALLRKNMMMFASALIQEEAYDEARDVLAEYGKTYGYDDECRLARARIALLEGDDEHALQLYEYLCSRTELVSPDADEVQAAKSRNLMRTPDYAMLNYLVKAGENLADYASSAEEYEDLKRALTEEGPNIHRIIRKAIEADYAVSKEAADLAEAVSKVSGRYLAAVGGEEAALTGKYKRAFAALEEEAADFFLLDCVNKARLKAYVLAGEYNLITKNLSKYSSYHELMIAAELYMSGLVKKSDFSEDFQEIDKEDAASVKARIGEICSAEGNKLKVQEKKALKARGRAISKQLDDPALVTIKEKLGEAATQQAGTDETKVYLEMSKIEHYFGNQASTEAFLSTAIYSSQDNEDDSYVAAMSQIITVISNDEESETENIKNVSAYVNNVLDHSLTVNVEQIISPQYNSQAAQPVSTEDGDEVETTYSQVAVDFVSKIKTAVTIGKIDTENFEEIKATVQIDSNYGDDLEELKDNLKVYDCGAEITDFTLEKVEYTGSNIILVCDVSGSMEYNINDLRTAVTTFVEDKNESENIAIVSFSSSIVGALPFGTSDEDLKDFAAAMYPTGGTDMFTPVVACLVDYSERDGESNVLILMTDGQDNDKKSAEDIYSQIGSLALQKGVIIYTMGLGQDVDTEYLTTIANSGNGDFVYVSDSISLTSFYDMLHARVYSQYVITYKAEDTITMSSRTLEVAIPEAHVRDVKRYSLVDESEEEDSLAVTQGMSISNMYPRFVYKGSQDFKVKLKGNGFAEDAKVTIKLNGNIDYDLKPEFVDAQTYEMIVPSSIAVGDYNVEIMINGKKKILYNGFSVIQEGNEKKTVFGPYVFTSAQFIENAPFDYTLRGAVTLNGWLHFKGDLRIQGNPESDHAIKVTDDDGSYIVYDESTSEGYAKYLAEKGIGIEIVPMREFRLFNDPENLYDYEEYAVEDIMPQGIIQFVNVIFLTHPVLHLYPDCISIDMKSGSTILPYQDTIFNRGKKDKKKSSYDDLFEIEFEFLGKVRLTDKKVGLVLEYEQESPESSEKKVLVNLFNSPVKFGGSFKFKINTIKNEYMLGAGVNFDFFDDESEISAEVEWKENLIPDSVKLELELDKAVKLNTAIPIEVNKFGFMVSDINQAIDIGNWAGLKFTGSAELTSVKIDEYFPALKKFVGDMAIFKMPDTSATIRINPFTVEAEAELYFLEEIKLAEAALKLGTFEYTNPLLQIDNESVSGLHAMLKIGIMWKSADGIAKIEASGKGTMDVHSRFAGIGLNGSLKCDIGWWIFHHRESLQADMAFGLYTTHNDKKMLVLAYKTPNKKGKFYYIDENGNCGDKNGSLN